MLEPRLETSPTNSKKSIETELEHDNTPPNESPHIVPNNSENHIIPTW
jgi:hypothetical protein